MHTSNNAEAIYCLHLGRTRHLDGKPAGIQHRSKYADRLQSDLFHQNGISHAFVLQFHSIEDRDYYVNNDPVHKAFKEAAAPALEKAIVVDYQNGVFTSV
jgi:hypothetical protein